MPVDQGASAAADRAGGLCPEPEVSALSGAHPSRDDPMERIIADALDAIGMAYTREHQHSSRLDFRLTDSGVEIEVKQFHSPRISGQMARAENVIAIQGKGAVKFFAALLHRSKYRHASAIEARSGATAGRDPQDESAVPQADAQPVSPTPDSPSGKD